jgi:[DsrC]-trisulfide reductase subunit K
VDNVNKEALKKVLKSKINRQLLYYLDLCARCSICKDACHQYTVTKDVLYLPAYRAELIRRIYKKYHSPLGKLFPKFYEGREIDDEKLLGELYTATYACTGCRRCMYFCPFSIDTTWILGVAKEILIAAGMGCSILEELANAAIEKGKSIDLFKDIMVDMLKSTEEELQQKTGNKSASLPIDKEGADILYIALSGTHTILPAAIIFHEAKKNWTLSLFEAANYGYFLGDSNKAREVADRIVDEAKRLKVKEIIITECGHAYRVMKFLYEAWAKEKLPFKVTGIVEAISDYVDRGEIKLKPGSFKEPLTYHDPCQVGRNAGFFDEPRKIIKTIASDFREMTPNREKNWCCGGGGGLVANPEMEDFRIKTGKVKIDQIKLTGANSIVSPCENCRLQLDNLNQKHELGLKIISLMDFVVDAMPLPGNI